MTCANSSTIAAKPSKTKPAADQVNATPALAPVYYNAKDIASLIRVEDFRSIYKMVAAGKIPKWCVTKIGNRTLFRRDSIERWLAENTGT